MAASHDVFLEALKDFCQSVTQKLTARSDAGPEAQLHGPLLELLDATGQNLIVQAESRAESRVGIPDFAVLRDRLLIGYIETKAPGTGEFAPVAPEVWAFEVSGLKVLQSWLAYRMKRRSGKRSSPLDDIGPERWTAEFTSELLRLLWILEHTLAAYPGQAGLLDRVLASELIKAGELPTVPAEARKAPRINPNRGGDLFES